MLSEHDKTGLAGCAIFLLHREGNGLSIGRCCIDLAVVVPEAKKCDHDNEDFGRYTYKSFSALGARGGGKSRIRRDAAQYHPKPKTIFLFLSQVCIILKFCTSKSVSQGKLEEADLLYLRAIDMQEGSLGAGTPQFALTLNNRATLLLAQVMHLRLPCVVHEHRCPCHFWACLAACTSPLWN